MIWHTPLIALFVIPLAVAVCAKGSVERPECKLYRFEGGVLVNIRSDAVKSSRGMPVSGGFRLFSIELKLPSDSPRGHLQAVYLSAFFRPLKADEVECQEVTGTGAARCYASIPKFSMQVSTVFDRSMQRDISAATLEVADQVERSVLNCD